MVKKPKKPNNKLNFNNPKSIIWTKIILLKKKNILKKLKFLVKEIYLMKARPGSLSMVK